MSEKRSNVHKEKLKRIIGRLTERSKSVFSEKVFLEAGEFGIGEMHVQKIIEELQEEEFISRPMHGVLKRLI